MKLYFVSSFTCKVYCPVFEGRGTTQPVYLAVLANHQMSVLHFRKSNFYLCVCPILLPSTCSHLLQDCNITNCYKHLLLCLHVVSQTVHNFSIALFDYRSKRNIQFLQSSHPIIIRNQSIFTLNMDTLIS